jgi:uncharacterized BrkB/YihY/UPF0761 family membrane protein
VTIAATILAVAAFIVLFSISGTMRRVREVFSGVWSTAAKFREPDLSDDDRERLARRVSFEMFSHLGAIGLRTFVAALPSWLLLEVVVAAGLSTWNAIERAALSWPVIGIACLVGIASLYRS